MNAVREYTKTKQIPTTTGNPDEYEIIDDTFTKNKFEEPK
jgi:hypothetical protein